ncbi:MAG: cation-transporting P-type ATPase, partial [Candidatus Omnitrophica bacterium]|nr:cation-transporting P-type ATPase [Candidatus Omnitrophota bacterium]
MRNFNQRIIHDKKELYFNYACMDVDEILRYFKSSFKGISEEEAKKRLEEYGYNEVSRKKKRTLILQLLSKFINPLVVVLIVIASLSLFL